MKDDSTILDLFRYQAHACDVYADYLSRIGCQVDQVATVQAIPMLPIGFFRTHVIRSTTQSAEHTFYSSGTTMESRSAHPITSVADYQRHALDLFHREVYMTKERLVMALIPGYAPTSSLVTMLHALIDHAAPGSGFYGECKMWPELIQRIEEARVTGRPVILFGVTHALMDLAKLGPFAWNHVDIMETGGMKGRGREFTRPELHHILHVGLGATRMMSEYGMTELTSQAYALDGRLFEPNEFIRVLPGDPQDPFGRVSYGALCRLDIIDMANVDSCAFIASEDIGRVLIDGRFEVLGRLDHSVVRGCSQMMV